jgi:hypothetical protein
MKAKFTITVGFDMQHGHTARVECAQNAAGMDAVAAIRALVDETARLTGRTPEYILGLVEKHTITVDDGLLLAAGARRGA